MVVMVIIAILTAIGAGGFIMLRNSSEVDAVAEDLVTAIREAQNKSISVAEGSDCGITPDETTKLWSVRVINNDFYLGYVCGTGTTSRDLPPITTPGNGLSPYNSVSIIPEVSGSPSSNPSGIYFSTPFGKAYAYPEIAGPKDWEETKTKISEEWEPKVTGGYLTGSSEMVWRVRKNNYERVIRIQANGDVREE